MHCSRRCKKQRGMHDTDFSLYLDLPMKWHELVTALYIQELLKMRVNRNRTSTIYINLHHSAHSCFTECPWSTHASNGMKWSCHSPLDPGAYDDEWETQSHMDLHHSARRCCTEFTWSTHAFCFFDIMCLTQQCEGMLAAAFEIYLMVSSCPW